MIGGMVLSRDFTDLTSHRFNYESEVPRIHLQLSTSLYLSTLPNKCKTSNTMYMYQFLKYWWMALHRTSKKIKIRVNIKFTVYMIGNVVGNGGVVGAVAGTIVVRQLKLSQCITFPSLSQYLP